MPPIPPIPPSIPGAAGGFLSSSSTIIASVVNISEATPAASVSAVRTTCSVSYSLPTLVGSMIPAFIRSLNSPTAASYP